MGRLAAGGSLAGAGADLVVGEATDPVDRPPAAAGDDLGQVEGGHLPLGGLGTFAGAVHVCADGVAETHGSQQPSASEHALVVMPLS